MGAGSTERERDRRGLRRWTLIRKQLSFSFLSRQFRMMRIFTCVILFFGTAIVAAQTLRPGTPIPQIKGTTLEEQAILLPDAVRGKVTLLIITFSKAAGELGRGWNDPFLKDYPQDDKVTSYAIAMLERCAVTVARDGPRRHQAWRALVHTTPLSYRYSRRKPVEAVCRPEK